MATYLTQAAASRPAARPAGDTRHALKLAAQMRLSGATSSYVAACNPADLSVPSVSRVVDFDFDDGQAVRTVQVVQVADEDLDW